MHIASHLLVLLCVFFSLLEEEGDLVIEYHAQCSTSSSVGICERTSVQPNESLLCVYNLCAIPGSLVLTCLLSALVNLSSNHEVSSHSINWIGDVLSTNSVRLGEEPFEPEGCVLWILHEHALQQVITTEVHSSVWDDSNDGNVESTVQGFYSSLSVGFLEAIRKTRVSLLSSLSKIGGHTGSCEIQWVYEDEGRSTSTTTSEETSQKLLGVGVVLLTKRHKGFFELILERKVQCLGWEVTKHVSSISTPVCEWSLLLWQGNQAINKTVVSSWVGLVNQLYTLQWSIHGLCNGSSGTSSDQIGGETCSLCKEVVVVGHLCGVRCEWGGCGVQIWI
mmetsp:Transcript_11439/g.42959  ORF Transcript_11439/g.42959 Transcript_11439/m.42959 type:complete len:335 (-) Transcript_11439:13-1017(-)